MLTIIFAIASFILELFGISWTKEGVSWNWRRTLLWALILPCIVSMGGIIYTVGKSTLDTFSSVFSNGIPSYGTGLEWDFLPVIPGDSVLGIFWPVARYVLAFFCVDIFVAAWLCVFVLKIARQGFFRLAHLGAGAVKLSLRIAEGKN